MIKCTETMTKLETNHFDIAVAKATATNDASSRKLSGLPVKNVLAGLCQAALVANTSDGSIDRDRCYG